MKKEEDNLIKVYFKYQLEHEKKYGEDTVILMQVGSFFEMYGVDNGIEKIGNLKKITTMLNIILSRKNKKILENSQNNALMAGIPTRSLKRYLNILLQNKYTVVLIEQVTPPPNPKRKITNIFSPGTYIDEITQSDSNNIVSIYLEKDKCYKSGQPIWSVGLSSLDLSTGNNLIYETHSYGNDLQTISEEIYRFVESNNPSEILLNGNNIEKNVMDKIKNNLNLINRILHNNKKYSSSFHKVSYQNSFLSKIFKDHGILTPIEYLDLEKKTVALLSYMIILQFSYEHNENIIKNINKPKIWNSNEHLILYHDSIYQLNILQNSNSLKGTNKIKSLFDVINKTKTTIGKRLLKYRLTNPITNISKLNNRYDLISTYMDKYKTDEIKNIETNLKQIIDIERLHRKIGLKKLNPCEFYQLHYSYQNINEIIKYIKQIYNINKIEKDNIFSINDNDIKQFKSLQDEYNEIYIIDEIGKHTLDNITNSFIKTGKNKPIDEIARKIKESMNYLENESERLTNMIDMNTSQQLVKVYHTERDGYFLTITKTRFKILKDKLEKDEYEYSKHTGNSIKLINNRFREYSNKYIANIEKIKFLVKDFYLTSLEELYNKYSLTLKNISKFIAEIDIIQSNSTCAIKYGYNRPIIYNKNKEDNKSYFDAKDLRHPIIERLSFSSEYVTNDISIGKNILLYGVNGSGKSSLSKAIGLNIILAQAGMFVPCSYFKYYPYTKIFTRINSDDNIFKGQSSFVVEMCELRSILKYSDKNSIVLGDEICKGTEEISALSIVFASIKKLVDKGVNFILATHFHKLYELCKNNKLVDKLSFKHLTIKYIKNNIKYIRKLEDGPGDNIYGIEIAKFIINDDLFINSANEIRNQLLNRNTNILEPKTSNYNKDLFINKCSLCNKNINNEDLHTHHIKEQNEFDENDLLGHIKKNNINNLIVLCHKHHDEVHHGKLIINGYIDTIKGKILDYNYLTENKKNKKKFNDIEIKIIKTYCDSKLSMNNIILQLKNKYKISISKTTIRKIFAGNY